MFESEGMDKVSVALVQVSLFESVLVLTLDSLGEQHGVKH